MSCLVGTLVLNGGEKVVITFDDGRKLNYLISNDPAYISSHKNARNLIQRIERYEIIEELVRAYLEK